MNTITHKGYTAYIEYDGRDNLLIGRLLGVRGVIAIEGCSVAEIEADFREAVKDYQAACKHFGDVVATPDGGQLTPPPRDVPINTMTYKGYTATVEYSAEDHCLVGHLAGICDIVGFHGESVDELHGAFHEAVDHYLAACEHFGDEPNKPASSGITLHLPTAVHSAALAAASKRGESLDRWAEKAFTAALAAA
jgi:predicted HicB family RNase H-like nuclease